MNRTDQPNRQEAASHGRAWPIRVTIARGLLAVLTVWPAVHLYLTKAYDLSSWKLAGWGMYATPRPETFGMEVYGRFGSGPRQHLSSPSPSVAKEAAVFLESYKWLRRLSDPARLVRAVLVEHPDWDRLEIEVFRSDLDPTTGMIVLKKTVIVHR